MSVVLAWLVKNWRLLAYALAAVVVVWMAMLVLHWRKDSTVRLPEAQAALQAEVACNVPSKCAERVAALQARQAVISETVVRGYEDEIKSLRDRPIPERVIRVCRPAGTGDVRDASAAQGTGNDASTPAGLDRADEYPTRPFREYALDAAALAAQCRAIIQRDNALAQKP